MRKVFAAIAFFLVVTAASLAQTPAQSKADVEKRVDSILRQMTVEEKIDYIGGVDGFFVRGIPRLNLPRLKMADGPVGVRNEGPATAMAGGIALAATWNPSVAGRVGEQLGRDARAKGVHFLLGPGVNIYRAGMNGRNFEYFGEDPFLASRIAVGYIQGVQKQGVVATIKHYMGNNSEFLRHDSDSMIDERTMREIYLPAFEAAVKEAHVGAVMDSYNFTNGAHLTQNEYLNTGVLKKEWGFEGVLMSDWDATYDGVAAANGGMDLEMPSGAFMNRQTLMPAIQQGRVSMETIDDKVRRILRTAIEFGWLDREQTDLSIPRFNQEGRRVALEAAREGMVLLNNEGAVLPLDKKKIQSIAVIGPDAYPAVPVGGGSAQVAPFAAVSILEGLSNALGAGARVYYSRGIPTYSELAQATNFTSAETNGQWGLQAEYFNNADLTGSAYLTQTEPHVNFGGTGWGARANFPEQAQSERWTGYYVPQSAGTYDVFVQSSGEDGGSYRLTMGGKTLLDDWKVNTELLGCVTLSLDAKPHKVVLEHKGRSSWLGAKLFFGIVRHGSYVSADAKTLAAKADAVVVAAGFDPHTESEGADRTFSLPPGQDELIQEIAAANKKTIVAITSGGGVDMSAWVERVPAIIEAWYPGQEGGTALAEIVFGETNPSGRLPATFERRWEDNPVHDSYYLEPGTNKVVYKEGVFVGYRGYEKNRTKPLFPFGHGLSYTTFSYSKLSVTPGSSMDGKVTIAFDVTNTGKREGADVAQVYVGDTHAKVPRPAKELKGFSKVFLKPGETKHLSVALDRRAFAYYDASAKEWRAEPGDYDILVGRSSEQIELRRKVALTGAAAKN